MVLLKVQTYFQASILQQGEPGIEGRTEGDGNQIKKYTHSNIEENIHII